MLTAPGAQHPQDRRTGRRDHRRLPRAGHRGLADQRGHPATRQGHPAERRRVRADVGDLEELAAQAEELQTSIAYFRTDEQRGRRRKVHTPVKRALPRQAAGCRRARPLEVAGVQPPAGLSRRRPAGPRRSGFALDLYQRAARTRTTSTSRNRPDGRRDYQYVTFGLGDEVFAARCPEWSARSSTTSQPFRDSQRPDYLLGLTDVRGQRRADASTCGCAWACRRRSRRRHAHPRCSTCRWRTACSALGLVADRVFEVTLVRAESSIERPRRTSACAGARTTSPAWCAAGEEGFVVLIDLAKPVDQPGSRRLARLAQGPRGPEPQRI